MDKLIIPFDGKTEKEVDDTALTTFIGFDRLLKLMTITTLDLDDDEKVAGFVIDKTGITVKIETV
jgi:hypothetical protein